MLYGACLIDLAVWLATADQLLVQNEGQMDIKPHSGPWQTALDTGAKISFVFNVQHSDGKTQNSVGSEQSLLSQLTDLFSAIQVCWRK